MNWRMSMFDSPPPTGWTPAIGEIVYLHPGVDRLGCYTTGRVVGAGGKFFLIEAGFARTRGHVELHEIRPLGSDRPRKAP